MGLGRSKEEAPPDDAAPPAPAETPPPTGVNFTSDEEEAVQVRKSARAARQGHHGFARSPRLKQAEELGFIGYAVQKATAR